MDPAPLEKVGVEPEFAMTRPRDSINSSSSSPLLLSTQSPHAADLALRSPLRLHCTKLSPILPLYLLLQAPHDLGLRATVAATAATASVGHITSPGSRPSCICGSGGTWPRPGTRQLGAFSLGSGSRLEPSSVAKRFCRWQSVVAGQLVVVASSFFFLPPRSRSAASEVAAAVHAAVGVAVTFATAVAASVAAAVVAPATASAAFSAAPVTAAAAFVVAVDWAAAAASLFLGEGRCWLLHP
ncbi:hypothetical protein QTP88_003798 [Uroleucon formosanum]